MLCFFPGFKNVDSPVFFILFKKLVYDGKLVFRKIQDPLLEFLVKFCFYLGNIFPFCTNTGFGSGQTDLQRIVQKEYSITVF